MTAGIDDQLGLIPVRVERPGHGAIGVQHDMAAIGRRHDGFQPAGGKVEDRGRDRRRGELAGRPFRRLPLRCPVE